MIGWFRLSEPVFAARLGPEKSAPGVAETTPELAHPDHTGADVADDTEVRPSPRISPACARLFELHNPGWR